MPNSFGTLTPKELVLDVFAFLRVMFPQLSSISTDFTRGEADFGQEVISRIVTVPSVSDYHTTNGYVAGDAATVDIPVQVNRHRHVSLSFGEQELAGTSRNLVSEQTRTAAYALAKDAFDALLGVITPANFPFSATAADNQETIETASNVDSDTTEALRDALNGRKANAFGRFVLFNSPAAKAFGQDPAIKSRDYATHQSEHHENAWRHFRNVSGFKEIWEYPDLPSANNLIGFAGSKDSLVIASRVPKDPASLVSGMPIPGKIEVVTDPDTGLSMMYRYFYDMKLGKLQMTLTWMFGVAKGVANNGQRLVSASTNE